MLLKVIFTDGTPGIVRSPTLEELIQTRKIVAIYGSEGWVELRRTTSADYEGPERRVEKSFDG